MKSVLTGLRAWTVQRVSAAYLLFFLLFMLAWVAVHHPMSEAQWRAWVTSGGMREATMLFFAALLAHMWVGLRDVVLDYVKPLLVRTAVLGVLALGLAALGSWVALILIPA